MTDNKIPEEEKEESIVFYCKDCEDIVDVNRIGSKYVYKCKKCFTKNVAFGTTKSIQNFFRIDEKKKREELKRDDKKDEKKIVITKDGAKNVVDENVEIKNVVAKNEEKIKLEAENEEPKKEDKKA